MTAPYCEPALVSLDVSVPDAVTAIRAAGQLLVDAGRVSPSYVDAMVEAFHTLGPYIVIAPGIAMPHARPGTTDLPATAGIAVVRLAQPVTFGHPDNDPVRYVIPLVASDGDNHLALLRLIATVLSDPASLEVLGESTDTTHIAELFRPSKG